MVSLHCIFEMRRRAQERRHPLIWGPCSVCAASVKRARPCPAVKYVVVQSTSIMRDACALYSRMRINFAIYTGREGKKPPVRGPPALGMKDHCFLSICLSFCLSWLFVAQAIPLGGVGKSPIVPCILVQLGETMCSSSLYTIRHPESTSSEVPGGLSYLMTAMIR